MNGKEIEMVEFIKGKAQQIILECDKALDTGYIDANYLSEKLSKATSEVNRLW